MMRRVTRIERRGSEFNIEQLPESDKLIPWTEFISDMKSTDREFKEVKALVEKFKQERIDIRPYMIHQPFIC